MKIILGENQITKILPIHSYKRSINIIKCNFLTVVKIFKTMWNVNKLAWGNQIAHMSLDYNNLPYSQICISL